MKPDVEDRVMQTIAAQVPADTPEPTVDIPATVLAAEFMARQTREPVLIAGSPGFAPTSEPAGEFVPEYGFSVSDETVSGWDGFAGLVQHSYPP